MPKLLRGNTKKTHIRKCLGYINPNTPLLTQRVFFPDLHWKTGEDPYRDHVNRPRGGWATGKPDRKPINSWPEAEPVAAGTLPDPDGIFDPRWQEYHMGRTKMGWGPDRKATKLWRDGLWTVTGEVENCGQNSLYPRPKFPEDRTEYVCWGDILGYCSRPEHK